MKMYRLSTLTMALLLATFGMLWVGKATAQAYPPPCYMRLAVELTPDVPDPSDPGFLSSLLDNQVGYQLTLQRERTGSIIVVALTGPGPDYSCQNVVETLRRDGRVLSVHEYPKASATSAKDSQRDSSDPDSAES